jgi:hypothetical protein
MHLSPEEVENWWVHLVRTLKSQNRKELSRSKFLKTFAPPAVSFDDKRLVELTYMRIISAKPTGWLEILRYVNAVEQNPEFWEDSPSLCCWIRKLHDRCDSNLWQRKMEERIYLE